jgi:hypothetical protein
VNELTARLESLLRRLHAVAQDESDPGAARFSAHFRAELQSLMPSMRLSTACRTWRPAPSLCIDLLAGAAPARDSRNRPACWSLPYVEDQPRSEELNGAFNVWPLMVKRSKPPGDELALPLLWIVSAILGVFGCFWLLLFYFSQPTTYPNPGLAAFNPPAGTRLLPLPRKSDAPELADLADEPPSALAALAHAQGGSAEAQGSQQELMPKPPVRKRPVSATRENDQRTFGLGWNNGYGNGNRAWSVPRKMSGGPKSSL